MRKLESKLVDQVRQLRRKGYSFGEMSLSTGLAKSTLYAYSKDILLDAIRKQEIEMRRKEKCYNKINPRKGKCLAGREIIKPSLWSRDLVHTVSHFIFDGRIDDDGCIYYSKDKYQIEHMRNLLRKIFRAKPRIKLRNNGVYGLVFYNVEFANYIRDRSEELFAYLNNGATKVHKKEFLKAFFDDEGCIFYNGDKRRVRGYQKSDFILRQIRSFLFEFDIESRIDRKAHGIEISGYKNLETFSREINFSPKIYINPNRKNGIWKKKISKREILDLVLKAYNKNKQLRPFFEIKKFSERLIMGL